MTCFICSFKYTESVTLSSEICNRLGRGQRSVRLGGRALDEQQAYCFLGIMARKLFFFFLNRGFTVTMKVNCHHSLERPRLNFVFAHIQFTIRQW